MRPIFPRALTVALAVLGGAAAMAFPKLIVTEAVPESGPALIAARTPDAMTVIHVAAPAPSPVRPAAPRRVATKPRPAAPTPIRSSVVSWTPPAPSAPTAPAPTPPKTARPLPTPAPAPRPTPAPTPTPSPEPTPTPAPEAPAPSPAEEPVVTEEPVRALVAVVDQVEEKVEEKVERKKDKPPKRDRTFPSPSPAPDDNGPIVPVGFGVTPSAEQPPADDEQGDADDQSRLGGGAEDESLES